MKYSSTSSERRGTIVAVIIVALTIAFVVWFRHKDEGRVIALEVSAAEAAAADSAATADTVGQKSRTRRKKKQKPAPAPPPTPRDYLDEVIESE